MDQTSILKTCLDTARRRKWWFVVPTAAVLAISIYVLKTTTPMYRSAATILIEDTELPTDLLDSPFHDFVERRLESISRQVMVSESLLKIINRYDLYPDERRTLSSGAVADIMRRSVKREMIHANVVDPRSGQQKNAAVAFTVSFEHGDPATAQRVTNELVSLYLNENLRKRKANVENTTSFLAGARERADERVQEIQDLLADFRSQNANILPERSSFNQQMVAQVEGDLRDLNRAYQSLRERESFFTAQLSQINPYLPSSESGDQVLTPKAELELTRKRYAQLSERYGPEHPDVQNAKRRISTLELSLFGNQSKVQELEATRHEMRALLTIMKGQPGDDDPETKRIEQRLLALDQQVAAQTASATQSSGFQNISADQSDSSFANNPAYIALFTQLASMKTEAESIVEQKAQTEERLAQYRDLVSQTPKIEGEYNALRRRLADVVQLRDQLADKERSARLGQTFETELKSERLSIVEPPSLPGAPFKPNKKLILLLGAVMAIGSGLGSVTVSHLLDGRVWASSDITKVIGFGPLAILPHIETERAAPRSQRFWLYFSLVSILAIMLSAMAAWFVMRNPLGLDSIMLSHAGDTLRDVLFGRAIGL